MREIKFRAWDEISKKFIYFTLNEIILRKIIDDDNLRSVFTRFLDSEKQQYTGSKDKNEKEIYEGDITDNGIVKWFDSLTWDSGGSSHPGFYFDSNCSDTEHDLDYHTAFDENIEVMGNIYENPELLEGKSSE